jgi:hypothetical protein
MSKGFSHSFSIYRVSDAVASARNTVGYAAALSSDTIDSSSLEVHSASWDTESKQAWRNILVAFE